MCGLVALFKRKEFSLSPSLARAMAERVAHRGPDDAGVALLPDDAAWQIALAHRRLSIIDRTPAAAQPMAYANRYWLIYNGEVYNHPELRRELEQLGHRFRTRSDSEVVLAAFAEWGARCFQRLRGMWGLVLVDTRHRTAVLCRDRLGMKPLYVWRSADVIAVVSEIKQLMVLPTFRARLSEAAVDEYLATGYEDHHRTFFSDVEPVPPGASLTLSVDDRTWSPPQAYWWPEKVQVSVHDVDEASERFAAKLDECVRIHLRSDVPVACALSGGLDSSAVAVVSDRLPRDQPLPTFTSTCAGDPAAERQYVDAVLNRIRARPCFVQPTAQQFLDDLDDFVWHHDEPVSSVSIYAGYCVARAAHADGQSVLLSGEGGDEVLSGYWQSYFLYLRELALEGSVFRLAAHVAGALLPEGNPSLLRQAPLMLRRYLARRNGIADLPVPTSAVLDRALASRGQARRLNDLRLMYLPRLLKWDDRNSMAFSVEGRYPFLDHELVELCLSFAPEVLYHRGWTKWPLRLGLKHLLPDEVSRRRSKYGFWVPQDDWLCGPLRPALTDWLERDRPLWSYLDRRLVRKLADQTWRVSGRSDVPGQALARCFMLDKWLEVFEVNQPARLVSVA